MPHLGKYAEAVLSSYAATLILLVLLVVMTIRRGRKVRQALEAIERKRENDA